MALTQDQLDRLTVLISSAWDRFIKERSTYAEINDYYHGRLGIPSAPDGADVRLHEIAEHAIDNVLPTMIDALTTPLSVVGFRTADTDDDLDVYADWQAQSMDARQTQLFRDANKFGRAYGFEDSDRFRIGNPLDSYAAYADQSDEFPLYGFTLLVDEAAPDVTLGMRFYDQTTRYELTVGTISQSVYDSTGVNAFIAQNYAIQPILNGYQEHGFGHAPIFKFGDGEPEITFDVMRRQRSINSSVYNRDVCEEFGAQEQKAIIGWDGSDAQKAKAGVTRIMAFKDTDVRIESFPASGLAPFIEAVKEKKLALAQAKQVSPVLLVPEANMAADMIALANAPYERKLQTKMRIFGEDVERWLRARGAHEGIDVPADAEVTWDETEPRSYAAVIDGIVKVASVEDKLTETLVEDIPGWTQQKVKRFMAEIAKKAPITSLAEAINGLANPTVTDQGTGNGATG